jgi:ABC-2 type transport system ATP-binding protein
MSSEDAAIVCNDLQRTYRSRGRRNARETVALRGVSFTVRKGSVFGLLGPNGAGKTTTVRILSTLLLPSAGSASVLGFDLVRNPDEVRRRIGLVLGGERGLYYNLSGRENLRYFAALNDIEPRESKGRIDELLTVVGLQDGADVRVAEYSRGMRQRLHIARGLLTSPELVFMDERTIGLDPIGALELRRLIPQLAAEGKTIFLTTHYMLEADLLCETICLLNGGVVVAMGSPTEIKQGFSKAAIVEVTSKDLSPLEEKLRSLPEVGRVESRMDGVLQKLTVHVPAGSNASHAIVERLGPETIESVVEREPNLEEAYVSILGRG